jgi:hypothetical protein
MIYMFAFFARIWQGKFRENGQSGYVLKPRWLRDDVNDFKQKLNEIDEVTLKIKPLFGRYKCSSRLSIL